MNPRSQKCIVFSVLLYATIFFPSVAADNSPSVNQYPSVDNALTYIRQAENDGKDVSTLIARFNEALNFLQQADRSNFDTCGSYASCMNQANSILSSIGDESILLQDQSEQVSTLKAIIEPVSYSTLVAFATTFAAVFGYKTWKSRRLNTLLGMEIIERQE